MKQVYKTPFLTSLLYDTSRIYKPSNAFIKSPRQDLVKDCSLSTGARLLVLLLTGWSGTGQAIETTRGIVGRHLGRSARTISRYLQQAQEAGYLTIAYTKDLIGYITGLKIYLNFSRIKPPQIKKIAPQSRTNGAWSGMANTNSKYIFKRDNTKQEQDYQTKLNEILARNGLNKLE